MRLACCLRLWCLPWALWLAACSPADRSGSVSAWLYERNSDTHEYALKVGVVEHLRSLRELRGRDIEVRRRTALTETLTLEGLALDIDLGTAFSLEYGFDEQGVVVPADLHSFHALTLYRNLDRVASLLREHGHVPLRPLVVFYLPRYDNTLLGDARLLFTDNAAYLSRARGFLIVPSFVLSELPMLLNEGVIAHEFGHAVIHQEMFGALPDDPHQNDPAREWVVLRRHLMAMHEGVADVIGFAATGDPDFIRPTANVDRDLSVPRNFLPRDLLELDYPPKAGEGDAFDPHYQGSLLARAVYELWPKDEGGGVSRAERGRMLELILAALRALHYEPGRFSLASFPDEFVRRMEPAERPDACAVLGLRLAPLAPRLTACP